MVKAEWGDKHSCPACGTRFYDLGKNDPVECVECGNKWTPEPVLKTKQPVQFEEADEKKKDDNDDLADDDLDIDEDDDSPDNDVDLGGDDDLGVDAGSDGDDDDN